MIPNTVRNKLKPPKITGDFFEKSLDSINPPGIITDKLIVERKSNIIIAIGIDIFLFLN